MKRKRVNLYVDVELIDRLKKQSARTMAPVSAMVRKAITEYLERLEKAAK